VDPVITQSVERVWTIDTGMAGERELNAVYLIAAAEPCLIEAGPGADGPAVTSALERLGVGTADLAHLVVTHVHLDHAGGAGAILRAYPRATLWVHERGAAHMADPTRLLASTARTYGETRMHQLFGTCEPCPAERIRAIVDGDTIALGDRSLRVIHTPGHASHHVALLEGDTQSLFIGEAMGTYIPWGPATRPALPPPEVDVEAAARTIDRLGSTGARHLFASHFGAVPDPPSAFDRAREDLDAWSGPVRRRLLEEPTATDDDLTSELDHVAASSFLHQSGVPLIGAALERYDVLGSIRMNAQGLGRYWRKRAASDAAAQES